MSFVKSYGDLIAGFFALIDTVYSKQEISFRAATLLFIASNIVPEPYSWIISITKSPLFERLKMLKEGLSIIYSELKSRITSLTERYSNRVYANSRNIATAILFPSRGSRKNIVEQHSEGERRLCSKRRSK